jgi:hypothetical protein
MQVSHPSMAADVAEKRIKHLSFEIIIVRLDLIEGDTLLLRNLVDRKR